MAQKTKLPVIHLDTYYHNKSQPYFEASDLQAWIEKNLELADQDNWIIDGNFGATFEERFSRADTVVLFDYPRYLCYWRILKRRFEFNSRHRQEMPADWEEKFDFGFMRYVWRFNRHSRPKIMNAVSSADAQLIIFKRTSEAEKYLQSI